MRIYWCSDTCEQIKLERYQNVPLNGHQRSPKKSRTGRKPPARRSSWAGGRGPKPSRPAFSLWAESEQLTKLKQQQQVCWRSFSFAPLCVEPAVVMEANPEVFKVRTCFSSLLNYRLNLFFLVALAAEPSGWCATKYLLCCLSLDSSWNNLDSQQGLFNLLL